MFELSFQDLGFPVVILVFLVASVVIALAGTRLTKYADQLADLTGLGEALVGSVLLGAITSFAGLVTSLTAAWQGYPALAISNAIGGIAVQTFFLALADIFYKKANLEHAAASLSNLMYSTLLIGLLAMVLLLFYTPEVSTLNFHPGSILILVIYLFGLRLISKSEKTPMWHPRFTKETIEDKPHYSKITTSMKKVVTGFIITAVLVAISGYFLARTGIAITERTGLSESFVGGLLTAFATSTPELIVSIAAVRQGALTMAVSNIVGGNSFEVLIVALADFLYLDGSIYQAITGHQAFIIVLTLSLMVVLLMGLLHRQEKGIARIGWESALIILLFAAGYVLMYFLE